jgi:hypothetical protein
MKKQKMKLALRESYLTKIKSAVGCGMFRNLYFISGGKTIDILQDGKLSCAHFASSILYLFGLIDEPRATVGSTVKDMERSGWKKIAKPRPGAVLVWEEKNGHGHIGFFLGGGRAVSNSSKKQSPAIHKYDAEPDSKTPRKVVSIWWHKKLAS